MRNSYAAGISFGLSAAVFLTLSASQSVAQELSERSVKTIMNYAWSYTPDKFTPPNGKTIFIDKKNREKMMVPVAKGREVIRVARLTAHAQICDLREDQVKNYRSLMLRETKSKQWTEQQIVYINQLHLTTVMMLVGKLQIVKKDGDTDKKVVVKEGKAAAKTCTAEQKSKVKELITKYVSSGPALASAANKKVKSQ
ncbi:MAG: hypothetical protein CBC34_010425 [Hyphomicrobiaceae bacterium TMED74]|nr:hypothetical protein [Filomicrobium sp.]RPG41218.1 MAG: hypothetical protein CBC34_010425 [Hyphomicrobiaceae bacterium TMED74]